MVKKSVITDLRCIFGIAVTLQNQLDLTGNIPETPYSGPHHHRLVCHRVWHSWLSSSCGEKKYAQRPFGCFRQGGSKIFKNFLDKFSYLNTRHQTTDVL